MLVVELDMFWTVVGIDTTLIPPEYSIRATKLSLTGYENDPSGNLGNPFGVGTTGLAIFYSIWNCNNS